MILALAALGVVIAAALVAYVWLLATPRRRSPRPPGVEERSTITVGDRERTFVSFRPTDLAPGSPLLIVLHGSNQTGASVRSATAYEFDELAVTKGFAVVYPDGYRRGWNDGRTASKTPARTENIDDVAFVRALIVRMREHAGIGEVFVTGYSNGGQMAYRLSADAGELLGGIATIAANLPVLQNREYGPMDHPLPILTIAGTADSTSPFTGGQVTLFGFSPRGEVLSADDTAAVFVELNQIATPATTARLPHRVDSGDTAVEVRTYRQDGKFPVVQITVAGGGHVIPLRVHRFPRSFGRTTHDIDAPAAIWDFFATTR